MTGLAPSIDIASEARPPQPLQPVEVEVINLFVQFSRALGQPRSVAEIFGLLFISPQPLALDDIIARLNLSKGTGSQGLKYLADLGAVRMVYVAGERRTHYTAVAELRNLVSRFLRQEILAHFEDSEARLDNLSQQSKTIPGEAGKHIQSRIQTLRSWEKSARLVLPLILRVMGNGKK